MKKIRLLVILGFVLTCLVAFASCGETKLGTPDIKTFTIEETTLTLTWTPVKNARGYKILVNNEEYSTKNARYPLDPLAPGDYEITVQAVASSGDYKNSAWSKTYEYTRPVESGLNYVLTNNNTEYEVSLGSASGHIVIEETYRGRPVTAIADMGFANKSKDVASVTILGDNLRKIGSRAFLNCSLITDINIPDSVTEIGAYAFAGCRGLTEIDLPDNLMEISNYAFQYCRGLTKVEIPDSVTTIGVKAFAECDALDNVVIPDSVVSMGEYAFTANVSLTNVTIGGGLESIPEYAFLSCDKLTKINLSKGLKTIEQYAFSGCAVAKTPEHLQEELLKGNVLQVSFPETLTTIGKGAFINCSLLTAVDFNDAITAIGAGAFDGSLMAAGNVTEDGFVFVDGWVLGFAATEAPESGKLLMPEGTVGIADRAFYKCDDKWTATSWGLEISNSVQYIGDYAFNECVKLGNLSLGEGLIRVGKYAFAKCTQLRNTIIADGVQVIDNYAFQGCQRLKVKDARNTENLPTTLTRVGTYAFEGTSYWINSLSSVYIGNWLVGWQDATIDVANIREGTVGLADYAFYGAMGLNTVSLPESVKHIGRCAFYNCSSLTTITLPMGLEKIEEFTFYQCGALAQIYIPNSVKSIGYSAFNKCYSLTEVNIPTAVEFIDDFAFYKCYSLTAVNFDGVSAVEEGGETATSNLKWIGERVFYNSGLTSITLPASLESLGARVFYKCMSLTSVTFTGDKLTEINDYMFYGCSALTDVTLPDGLKTIGNYAFRNCEALANITLGESLESIGRYAFYGCVGLETVKLPESLTTLGDYSFRNCNGLKSVVLPESLTTINKHVFNGCNNVTFYTEYSARPQLWIGQWNSSYRPVVWGCTLSEDKTYVESFTKTAASITNSSAVNGMSAPIKEGYDFAGWATSKDGEPVYTMETLLEVENGTTLYAVWTEKAE